MYIVRVAKATRVVQINRTVRSKEKHMKGRADRLTSQYRRRAAIIIAVNIFVFRVHDLAEILTSPSSPTHSSRLPPLQGCHLPSHRHTTQAHCAQRRPHKLNICHTSLEFQRQSPDIRLHSFPDHARLALLGRLCLKQSSVLSTFCGKWRVLLILTSIRRSSCFVFLPSRVVCCCPLPP